MFPGLADWIKMLLAFAVSLLVAYVMTPPVKRFAEKVGASYLVRGLRNSLDYGYEENIAAVNRALCPALDTVYFRAENAALSATLVRELCRYGDIRRAAAYVPAPVFAVLEARGK